MKPFITVIADDITGAAEMAGIGFRFGLHTALTLDVQETLPPCELLVVATDTRSMSREEAVAETRRILQHLREAGITRIFKKTDSALRGHIAAELQALLQETAYTHVLLLPHNPTRGRTVSGGIYRINGTPLHQTAFAYDPEFPALTSEVNQLVQGFPVTDATSMEQVMDAVAHTTSDVLLVGAADLFTAFLLHEGYKETYTKPFGGLAEGKALIVCGSTQSTSLDAYDYIRLNEISTVPLSSSAFYQGTPEEEWMQQLTENYRQGKGLVLTTAGYAPQPGKEFAVRLRTTTARIVRKLICLEHPHELVIEGGATAFAILQELGWQHFTLTDEVAPGVVRMKHEHPDVHIILKPGSYSWGGLFISHTP